MNYYRNFNFKEAEKLVRLALREDIGKCDITSELFIPSGSVSRAEILFKEDGIIAGTEIFKMVFRLIDKKIKVKFNRKDGDFISKGSIAGFISGNSRNILKGERTALNILQRMSGIATTTFILSKKLNNPSIKLLDTRKTTPNFRLFEKAAVLTGGGNNHRFGLYDMYLIKDNHIEANKGIEKTLTIVKKNKSKIKKKTEIEVKNIHEFETVLLKGKGLINRVMLDNFKMKDIEKAVKMNKNCFELEISGGVNEKNISKYGKLKGINYISAGFLTHSADSLDISLNFVT